MANIKNEKKNNYPKPMSIIALVFWTGLFGGIFWSAIGYFAYLFSLSDIHPNVILDPWAVGSWKKGWFGTILSLFLIGVISIGVAFVYYALLKKLNGIWPGIVYGIVLFFFVYLVLNPLFPSIGPFNQLRRETIITSICIYALYGLFIGYSISYEYQNHQLAKKEAAT